MIKLSRVQVLLAVFIAVVYGIVHCAFFVPQEIKQIGDIEAMDGGKTVTATYEGERVALHVIDANGRVLFEKDYARTRSDGVLSVADIAADSDGHIYILQDILDKYSGAYRSQELIIYDINKLLFQKVNTLWFDGENPVRYRWLETSTGLTMMGTDASETTLTRMLFDTESLENAELRELGSKVYTLDTSEGIYEAEPVGSDVAYITMSGKIYMAGGDDAKAKEVYPARVLDRLMYPTFIAANGDGSLLVGEQTSGDFITLDLASYQTTAYKQGGEPFSGLSNYAPEDIVAMSMMGTDAFSGVVKNPANGAFELIVCTQGDISVVTSLHSGVLNLLKTYCVVSVLALLIAFAVFFVLQWLRVLGERGHSIRTKLIVSALPILCVAMACIGGFTYYFYAQSIEESFYKQVEDEGNMLMALFGTESFAAIEFPYDYPDEAYNYLSRQMATRAVYTRTAYYENGGYYVGIDKANPCFYRTDTLMNTDLNALYQAAAYTGMAQTALISDKAGVRLTCVTPIGAGNSMTVYLLETGIPIENMNTYKRTYIYSFTAISLVFLLAIAAVMIATFVRVLRPLRQIQAGLDTFASGDRTVRLEVETNDELADISRVFNKLVGDVDLQLYELKRVSDVYYRFIPQQMLRLLGKENLGDVDLDSRVEGEYIVLMAGLQLGNVKNVEHVQELTSTFFNVMQEVSAQNPATTLLSDSANLRRLCLICHGGAEEGVASALAAIAKLDATNASLPIQLKMDFSFVVHKAELYYGICGDDARFMPTLISNEIDWLVRNESMFTDIASRLVVTTSAYDEIDTSHYFNRYIGTLQEGKNEAHGLYDFYDSMPVEHTRLINATLSTFNKAMALYEEGRYYDAKNMFVLVLRENRYDNVARHYLFACEQAISQS